MTLRTVPAGFALLLLGAHFLRGGSIVLAAACGLMPLLLLMRRRMALRAIQFVLAAGVAVWIHTTVALTRMRMQSGESWLRMLLILSAVVMFTCLCVWLLNTETVKRHFSKNGG